MNPNEDETWVLYTVQILIDKEEVMKEDRYSIEKLAIKPEGEQGS